MQLLRCLFFITTFFKVSVKAAHIAGCKNAGADALSRNNMHLFFSQVPTVNKTPSSIPSALIELLVLQQPDWTSLPDCSQALCSRSSSIHQESIQVRGSSLSKVLRRCQAHTFSNIRGSPATVRWLSAPATTGTWHYKELLGGGEIRTDCTGHG